MWNCQYCFVLIIYPQSLSPPSIDKCHHRNSDPPFWSLIWNQIKGNCLFHSVLFSIRDPRCKWESEQFELSLPLQATQNKSLTIQCKIRSESRDCRDNSDTEHTTTTDCHLLHPPAIDSRKFGLCIVNWYTGSMSSPGQGCGGEG